jgi:hypothetical protein
MTKASPGRRSRRLERRGRPTGSYKSLFKDAQRFSIAAWLASEPRYGPHVAARMATILIEERTPITIQDVEGLLLVIGADYKATASAKAPTSNDLDGRASQLADKARLMIARATPRELAWLTQSSGALGALSTFFVDENLTGVDRTIELLLRAGWHEILDRIVGRLDPALRASFPPYEGDLGPKGRWLLAVMRELKRNRSKT